MRAAVAVSFSRSNVKRSKKSIAFYFSVNRVTTRLLNIENLSRWFQPRSTKTKLLSSRGERTEVEFSWDTNNAVSIKIYHFVVRVYFLSRFNRVFLLYVNLSLLSKSEMVQEQYERWIVKEITLLFLYKLHILSDYL